MHTEKTVPRKAIVGLLLAVIALASALWLAELAASPEHNAAALEELDEKKVTVMELTAASAAASVAISAVPGDATTPLANQISQLSSYLLLVTGAILLEKILLTLTGLLAFRVLIPAACVLGIVCLLLSRDWLRQLAVKLAVFGLALWLVIPASLQVSSLVESTFSVQQTVEDAARAADTIEEEPEEESDSGWLSQIGDAIAGTVSGAVEQAENALGRFVDAVAALIIVNCVIPLLVLWLFLWLARTILGLHMDLPVQKLRGLRRGSRPREDGTRAGDPAP